MPIKPTITITSTHDNDATITFPAPSGAGRHDAWLTIDPNGGQPLFSLKISRTDEGLVLDVYPDGYEDAEAPTTAHVLFTDHPESGAR